MSIRGRPGDWFEQALRRGDLAGALSEASELPKPLPSADALALVVLLGDVGDARYDRWGARWVGRVAVERDSVSLATVGELVELLERASAGDAAARVALGALAARHGAVGAEQLLRPEHGQRRAARHPSTGRPEPGPGRNRIAP